MVFPVYFQLICMTASLLVSRWTKGRGSISLAKLQTQIGKKCLFHKEYQFDVPFSNWQFLHETSFQLFWAWLKAYVDPETAHKQLKKTWYQLPTNNILIIPVSWCQISSSFIPWLIKLTVRPWRANCWRESSVGHLRRFQKLATTFRSCHTHKEWICDGRLGATWVRVYIWCPWCSKNRNVSLFHLEKALGVRHVCPSPYWEAV